MSRRAPMARLAGLVGLAALLLLPGAAGAGEDAADALPWWAQGDYAPQTPPEPEVDGATPPAPESAEPEDVAWWAGGSGTVQVRRGDELPTPDPAGSVQEPAPPPQAAPPATAGAEVLPDDGDDGRNPLHHRPEGHRAGEDPGGSSQDPALPEDEERDEPNQCNRYAKQIPRYKAELEIAKDRGQDMAARALQAQIERLEQRQERVCPEPPKVDPVKVAMNTLLKAARLAAKVARIMYGSPF